MPDATMADEESQLATLLEELPLKPYLHKFVDLHMWTDEVETPDNKTSEKAATTYVARKTTNYIERGQGDNELWGDYIGDFGGWKESDFQKVQKDYLTMLKRTLRSHGVYTGRNNLSLAKSLIFPLQPGLIDSPEWPEDEIRRIKFVEEATRLYRRRRKLIAKEEAEDEALKIDTRTDTNMHYAREDGYTPEVSRDNWEEHDA